MPRKFGISLDDDIADRVEEPLEYGTSRSERIEKLIQAGLAVEEAFQGYEVSIDDPRATRAFLAQVFHEYDE